MAQERLISPLRVELGPAGWKFFFLFFFFFSFAGPVCFSITVAQQEPQRPRPTRKINLRGHYSRLLVDSSETKQFWWPFVASQAAKQPWCGWLLTKHGDNHADQAWKQSWRWVGAGQAWKQPWWWVVAELAWRQPVAVVGQ